MTSFVHMHDVGCETEYEDADECYDIDGDRHVLSSISCLSHHQFYMTSMGEGKGRKKHDPRHSLQRLIREYACKVF